MAGDTAKKVVSILGADGQPATPPPSPPTPEPPKEEAGPSLIPDFDALMKDWWFMFNAGFGDLVAKLETPIHLGPDTLKVPDWNDKEALESYINRHIQLNAFVRLHWPILMKKLPQGDAFLAMLPEPENLMKTMHKQTFINFNLGRVIYWQPVYPQTNEGVMGFFKKYMKNEGGRIALARGDVGTLPPPQNLGAMLAGGPFGRPRQR